jgi:hypothetical protein
VCRLTTSGLWRDRQPAGRESVPAAIFHQLQLAKGLVRDLAADANRELGSAQWQLMVVPFGGGVGRIMKLGFQPVALTAQFFGNAVHPVGTSAWTMRFQISFLFPKLSKEQQEMIMEKKLKQTASTAADSSQQLRL